MTSESAHACPVQIGVKELLRRILVGDRRKTDERVICERNEDKVASHEARKYIYTVLRWSIKTGRGYL